MRARQMHATNRLAEAKDLYRQVLAINPRHAAAWFGLGTLALAVGVRDAALQALAKAVELAPGDAGHRTQYARALQEAGRLEEAVAQLREACRLAGKDAALPEMLATVLQAAGDTEAARAAYHEAFRRGSTVTARAKIATLVSPVIRSREAMRAERAAIEAQLDELLADATLRFEDPMRAGLWSNFYLAFHGENDRRLQMKYAALYRQMCPSLAFVAPHCDGTRPSGRRIRVGLLSSFFFNHSIGRTSRGLFAQLSRAEFEVTAIFAGTPVEDDYSRLIREHAEHSVVVPQDLAAARRALADLRLDVLFYQDIGMDPFTYFLSFARLAPVQCVSYGHPDTTGVPAMDWFVSNDLYETLAAQDHYSERLFLLKNLGTLAYYYRPETPPQPKRREDFGLLDADHLYICPQNLFKIHPDMDDLIAGVLRGDPDGRLVVIDGRVPQWTALIRQRWAAAFPDVVDRVTVLPRQNSRDYVNLIALADVMLDTVHFNGMNTSLEALSVGTPIVTLPGEFQRGRHTQAMYRRMGIAHGIAADAADYVAHRRCGWAATRRTAATSAARSRTGARACSRMRPSCANSSASSARQPHKGVRSLFLRCRTLVSDTESHPVPKVSAQRPRRCRHPSRRLPR